MNQKIDNVLAVAMTCPTTIEVGDIAILSDEKEVIKNNAAGSILVVGTVCAHLDDATICTIETRFREHVGADSPYARTSGAAVSIGPFVFDANMQVINYDANTHDPFAIRGLVITEADAKDTVVETLEF